MRTYQPITLRRFTVQVKDALTGEVWQDAIVLSTEQLRAAQLVGQRSKELICRLYEREGYTVLGVIGKAERRTIPLDLEGIFNEVIVD